MIFKSFKIKGFLAGEKRLVFENGREMPTFGPSPADDSWYNEIPGAKTIGDVLGGIGDTVGGLGTVAGAGGRLLSSFANLVDIATIGIGNGIIGLQKGGVNLYNYLKDKSVGEPENLPEYKWMAGDFKDLNPDDYIKKNGLVVTKSTRQIMHYEYRMAILDALIYQAQALYDPAVQELAALLNEKESRDRSDWKKSGDIQRLREKMNTRERLLNEGNLGNGSMKKMLLAENEADEKSLAQLEGQTTKEIMWSMPQTQKIEFPAGSGRFVTRYLPGKKKVKVNIDKVCESLKSNVYEYSAVLNKYAKEKIKLKYWSEKNVRSPYQAGLKPHTWRDKAKFWKTEADEATIKSEYANKLSDQVKAIKAAAAAKFDKEPADPIYYLMEDPFDIRKSSVGTYKIAPEYIDWKKSGKIPEKLVRFGCKLFDGKIKKQVGALVYEFTLGEGGDVATQYPNNVHRRLPAGADPSDKRAWNPPMP